jgi:acetyl esterase/lipase
MICGSAMTGPVIVLLTAAAMLAVLGAGFNLAKAQAAPGDASASRPALAASQAATRAAAPGADTSRVQPSRQPDKEIVYKKTPQGELKLYVYMPAGWKKADKRPTIVFFFGGGFVKGSAVQFYSKAEYLASRGMVAFSAEYRVRDVHKTTIDKCVEDARSAMRYVRKNAADWGVDPDRIVSSGGSSGAHLAAAVAMMDGFDDPADDLAVSCRPAAMILFNPVFDFGAAANMERFIPGWHDRFPGETLAAKQEMAAKLSPIEHVRKGCPPAIMFYGTNDGLLVQGRDFLRKSQALGNQIDLWTAWRMGHGFFNATPWHEATLIKADEFLAALGYLKSPPTLKPADASAVLVSQTAKPETPTAPADGGIR